MGQHCFKLGTTEITNHKSPMSPLLQLHRQLAAVRQRRRLLRWCLAWSALAMAVLWSLAAIFVLDVGFALSVAQRVALMVLGLLAIVWAGRRYALPWLGIRESETDVALLVERQNGIDSDLVAALQFDGTSAESWGSRDLRTAVVSRMAEAGRQLDVTRGTDYLPLFGRVKLLGVSLLITLSVTAIYPRYVAVFFSRLLLSERHYPSATTIENISVNGTMVWEWNAYSARPRVIRSAKGRPVRFLVECSGQLPEAGSIECQSLEHGTSRTLELRQLSADELVGETLPPEVQRVLKQSPRPDLAATGQSTFYLAEMPQLVEGFTYSLRLGDAFTDSAEVQMIEPPVVEMRVEVIPPSYAAATSTPFQSPRHLAVLESSRVAIQLSCLNKKPLESATIRVDAGGTVSTHPLSRKTSEGFQWSLPENTPLASVNQELRYEIQVTDSDGLGLESPLRGYVQLKLDRPPTAVASIVHRVLLPDAKPTIEYRVNDDYGIASLNLQAQIERLQTSTSTIEAANEKVDLKIPLDPIPLTGQNLPNRGKFPLDLARFKLAKGDRLKLSLVVVDYRGQNAGKSTASEPILLEISDEAGVLAAITEADERSEKRLSDVIKQQLGVGGNK